MIWPICTESAVIHKLPNCEQTDT